MQFHCSSDVCTVFDHVISGSSGTLKIPEKALFWNILLQCSASSMGAHVHCLPARVFAPPASWNALHPGGGTSLSLFTSQLKCHPLRELFPNYDTSSVIVYTDNEHFPKLSSVMPTLLMAYFPTRITRTGTLLSLFPIVSHVPRTVPGIH